MSVPSWTAALRIARREAWRGKLRSALVIALIGLPVLILAGADIVYQTYTIGPAEQLRRTMGTADAAVQWVGSGTVRQQPGSGFSYSYSGNGESPAPPTSRLLASLPAGTRVIEYRHAPSTTTFHTRDGLYDASLVGLAYDDPIARGMVRQESGRAPRVAGEAAITHTIADQTGLGVGDRLRTVDPSRTFRIVGIVTDRDSYASTEIYSLPAAVPASTDPNLLGNADAAWLIDTPDAVTWSRVLQLDRLGYATLSRHDLLTASADASSPSTRAIATSTLIGGMVLLEIVLLAGPAFAVGARRRNRELALLAAVGGDRAALRRVVLADAVVLGLSAGIVGAAGGIGVAALFERWALPLTKKLPGPFDIPFPHLGGLVLVSIATALLAALAPAVRAARIDVVSALAGRRGRIRIHPHVPIAGLVLSGVGVAITLGTFASPSANSLIVGVALIELGLVIASPTLIAGVARLARWLPLSGRIALRDASRNRNAAAPAVAAVMASVIGAMAAVIGTASATAQDQRNYVAALPQRDTYVDLGAHQRDADAVLAALRRAAPDRPVMPVHEVAGSCITVTTGRCVDVQLSAPARQLRRSTIAPTWSSALPDVLVDDGSTVGRLLGSNAGGAAAALRAGHVVVTSSSYVRDGMVRLEELDTSVGPGASATGRPRDLDVAATVVGSGFRGFTLILPPTVLARLGGSVAVAGVLAVGDHPLGSPQRQRLAAGLAATNDRLTVTTEHGYSNPDAWVPLLLVGAAGAIAILAALIATALANVDSRPDLVTLAAVGASPHTRRVLSFSRAAVVAGCGTVIGALAGILPARAWARAVGAPVVIPWASVALAVVGIPLLAACLAGAFSRARLPSERPA